jgi:hypothetical protein
MACKRKSSVYVEHGWVKIKNPNYTQAEVRYEMFRAFSRAPATRREALVFGPVDEDNS